MHNSCEAYNFSSPYENLIFLIFFLFFQAPAAHPKSTVHERPHQHHRIVPSGEGVSFDAPSARGPSRSDPQIVAGRLASPLDLLTRCWLPSGELSY